MSTNRNNADSDLLAPRGHFVILRQSRRIWPSHERVLQVSARILRVARNDNRCTAARRGPVRPGFTLIELLVALAMIATIVSMVYGSYAATSGSLAVYDRRLSCAQRTQLALRLMSRQLRCAYAPTEPNHAESAPSQTSPASLRVERTAPAVTKAAWLKRSPPIFAADPDHGRGEILRFTTTAGLGGGLAAPQQLSYTMYRYDPLTQTLSLDSHAAGTQVAPQWRLLLDHVRAVELAFYDGRRWQPSWDYTQNKSLPRAVRIDLTVVDKNGRECRLGTAAAVGCRVAAGPPTTKERR